MARISDWKSNEEARDLCMNDRFVGLIQEVEFLLAESERFAASGPHFTIVRRCKSKHKCLPDEILAICYVYRSREIHVPLPSKLALLFDYLARHRHLPQTASRIEMGIKADGYTRRHGPNGNGSQKTMRIARASIKQYVHRIREAIGRAFLEAGVSIAPQDVLVSEPTTGREVTYRLRANVRWIHIAARDHKYL